MTTFNNIYLIVFSPILILFLLFSIVNQASASSDYKPIKKFDKMIEVCCSWRDQLDDNILTYYIEIDKKKDKILEKTVEISLDEWERVLANSIEFKKTKDKKNADIKIDFKKDIGGDKIGKTVTHLDKLGFIDYVEIYISKGSYGSILDLSIIKQISKHELGHSLGLGHSNFPTSLMFPMVDKNILNIQKCEIDAIKYANHFQTLENSDIDLPRFHFQTLENSDIDLPHISEGTRYRC